MGYLDSSTTNIVLDFVLTNRGRAFLARNDGSFAITKWALGDDDIDYSVVKQFSRIVGKEKIEKNTSNSSNIVFIGKVVRPFVGMTI